MLWDSWSTHTYDLLPYTALTLSYPTDGVASLIEHIAPNQPSSQPAGQGQTTNHTSINLSNLNFHSCRSHHQPASPLHCAISSTTPLWWTEAQILFRYDHDGGASAVPIRRQRTRRVELLDTPRRTIGVLLHECAAWNIGHSIARTLCRQVKLDFSIFGELEIPDEVTPPFAFVPPTKGETTQQRCERCQWHISGCVNINIGTKTNAKD